ncbi:squalene/phytoene synthase family protein [bacterium]|nr:squalene/phytoene synthase family protein [bacterium]
MVREVTPAPPPSPSVWSEATWDHLECALRRKALNSPTDDAAWLSIVRASRRIMARYTTSFFIVSRFLPLFKRQRVEVIYAAVRYPDEVVDTFPLSAQDRGARLARWAEAYERGLNCAGLREALKAEVPAFLAAFTRVVREYRIPPEHYRSFLTAMRRDISPRPFQSLEDLIENYVYGSAVVVGYFLAYVYGHSTGSRMDDALACSRDLGIALQLTNFLRDVKEDQRRGRLYLPLDLLRLAEADPDDLDEPANRRKILTVIGQMTDIADRYYQHAAMRLDVFAPDCRVAIKACIDVYRKLNGRIAASPDCIGCRESVPMREKLAALPPNKYWRLPLSLLGW